MHAFLEFKSNFFVNIFFKNSVKGFFQIFEYVFKVDYKLF